MNMKTKNILTVALLALTTIGCTDLDVDIKSQYTEYPSSDVALSARISNCYYAFRNVLGRRYDELVSCNSDEYTAVSFDTDYLNNRDMANISLHMADPDNSASQLDSYNDILSGITNCNFLLQDLVTMDMEEAEKLAISAPVRAARAFYTFLLMDNWGDTPIVDYTLFGENSTDPIDR